MVLFYDYKFSRMDISKILKFIHMVYFCDYKFSKMGIQENESFFCLKLKRLSIRAAKHNT